MATRAEIIRRLRQSRLDDYMKESRLNRDLQSTWQAAHVKKAKVRRSHRRVPGVAVPVPTAPGKVPIKVVSQTPRPKPKVIDSSCRNWIFRTTLPPGDILTLSAAVRDLHLAHPNVYLTGMDTRAKAIWENNPYVTDVPKEGAVDLRVHYPIIHQSNQNKLHFINGYRLYLEERMGVKIPPTSMKPDLHFSEQELNNRAIDEPYWVLFAGGKNDFTTKWWDSPNYQEVVDKLQGKVKFVQVGHKKDHHPTLKGVIDMIGETSFRELLVLIKHSEGVVCPITCGMHAAAACDKPCVVIGGGREPASWVRYEGHTYIHTIGQLECCRRGGCFKSKVGVKGRAHCQNYKRTNKIREAKCMFMIEPNHVVNAIEEFLEGGKGREILVEEKNPTPAKVITASDDNAGSDMNLPVTICVLLYGDFHQLHVTTLSDILENTDPRQYKLSIGCNEVCDETMAWINRHVIPRVETVLHKSDTNIYKYPMMKRMFDAVDTDWIIWFDDDTRVVSPQWFSHLAKDIKMHPDTACFGKKFFWMLVGSQERWIQEAAWYTGKELRKHKGKPKVDFVSGAFWAMPKKVLDDLNWPDPRIRHCGGDVMLGAALHQQDYPIRQSCTGIKIIHSAPRRGFNEPSVGSIYKK